jgi:hypothetical protein
MVGGRRICLYYLEGIVFLRWVMRESRRKISQTTTNRLIIPSKGKDKELVIQELQ